MKTRKFSIGPHIWFYVTQDADGTVRFLEEHDWREGGGIRADAGKTLAETFIAHAVNRTTDESEAVRLAAEEFLKSSNDEFDFFSSRGKS